jgi:hypothetical protein
MAIFNSYVKLPEGTYHYLLDFFARLSENLRQWIQKPLQGRTRQLRAEEWKYIYILLFLSIHILLVAWTVDQHIPASRFWNVQCSELLPCICCFIGNAHTHTDGRSGFTWAWVKLLHNLPHEVAFSASSVLVLLLQPFLATSHAIPRERLPCWFGLL